ncbi:MAG: hypothetical protein COV76_04440 [Candidatus Omnitrophica bacterium CG11_big_fil_rev_8_21_14_0_20_64_10]|nr:MAG: hypothetical protein COV76_04440 [Candidatus Omnitrophica bacterium CG11_big_fil_rev_8_21_14_0_20_64_10]
MKEQREEFLDKNIAFWQPRTSRKLTSEDARLMTERVVDFLTILAEWEAKASPAQLSPGDTHAP